MRVSRILVLTSGVILAFSPATSRGSEERDEESLQRFLWTFTNGDQTTKYRSAFIDLNGDGISEAIVYLSSAEWCGSGGCTLLILTRDADHWKLLNMVPITRPPIRILKRRSNGWQSIGVWVSGGGIQPGYEAEHRFDGKAYPENPSVSPARRLPTGAEGQTVLDASMHMKPLRPRQ